MGERPEVVGVLLQDMVPSTGVDASCGVSHAKCRISVPSRALAGPRGLSCHMQSWTVQPSSTAHRTRIWGSKRNKTKQTKQTSPIRATSTGSGK